MAEVVLTHGYFIAEDEREQQIMRPYPPLGILYVSAYLEQHDIANEVFDTTFQTKKKLFDYLLKKRPRYIGMYINLMTKLNVLDIITFVKQEETLSHTKLFIGGPDGRYNAESLLRHGADFVVIGEGEQTSLALIQELEKEEADISSIQGLAYLDDADQVVFTPERTKIKSINTLPFPNRKKIELKRYFEVWKSHHGQSAASVSTMRGCPYTCKWCSRAVYGLSYRRRSPQLVAEELAYLKNEYAPDTVWFVDDVFTVSHNWLREFKEEVIKQDAIIPYECITRADRMNEEVVQLLKVSGCFRVWIGAESGSQKVIDLMDRRVDVHQVREMIQLSQQKGIQAGTFIMLGYPGETEQDIEETVHHLKTANPDLFTITVAYPIKGTELYQEVEAIQTTNLAWETSTDRDIDFQRTYPRHYYEHALKWVNHEVNYHKLKVANKQYSYPAAKLKLKALWAKGKMWYVRKRNESPA
ncbi:MAG: B12-binding domain-containing radical SAM protein [Flammeovirgaceae bacterium]